MISALALFRRAIGEGEEARALARLARQPAQQRGLEQFNRALGQARDLDAALRDPRVMGVLGRALGVPEAATQPGLARRAFLSDLGDARSVANTLPDTRWKAAAQTLNLHGRDLDALKDPALQAKLAEGLQRAAWNEELEAQADGVGDAVVFSQRATSVASTYEILGNAVLRRVVTKALGLPEQIVNQSVEAQRRAIESRLDVAKLGDPRQVQRLAERYLAAKDLEAASATAAGGAASPWAAAAAARGITLLL
ncbi:DUF1217 domain-containing protein [Roseococcus sp. DSY-14]|uniref:DUF1217 domain-containing protein n=1 Tax=Roseococcus sp. DSY-14 TaxID=3369650 RepID=UPI00387AB460